jgi:hypothetical protein
MTTDVLERLRAANPVSRLPTAGPPPVFVEMPQSEARWWRAPLRSRRFFVLALGVVVLGIGAALAAARSGPWWNGTRQPPPVETSSAEKLVEFTLTTGYSTWSRGTRIAMWRLPQSDAWNGGGWVCYRVALASPAPTPNNGQNPLGGGTCFRGSPTVPPGVPMTVSRGGTAPGWSWLISGQVNPASGIAALELDSASGRLPLSYANGWFLAQLPPSGSGEQLPDGGPYVLVGRDDDGNVVARLDLEHRRASSENPPKARG